MHIEYMYVNTNIYLFRSMYRCPRPGVCARRFSFPVHPALDRIIMTPATPACDADIRADII